MRSTDEDIRAAEQPKIVTNSPIAELHQVSYGYPGADTWALKDISLTVHRGEFLGIIGPTGAGKTTLCLTFNGIVPQFYGGRYFGYARTAGLDTLEHPVSRLAAYVGMVFEDPETQITATSVESEIAFALENLQVPREEIRTRIREALAAVRLEGMAQRHPHTLSGGEKQRLAIAAALAVRPALLVLDEPTSQLDPVGKQELFATVAELNRTFGTTIVMASQAAEELATYADHLLLLAGGAAVALGTPDQVYSQVEVVQQHGIRPPQVTTTFHLVQRRRSASSNPSPVLRLPVRLEDGVAAARALWHQIGKVAPETGAATDRSAVTSTSAVANPRSAPPNADVVIRTRDLDHTYPNGTVALRGVNLDVHRGDYLAIVGQNGAGKSTLVKHFLNVLQPTAGTVHVQGTDVREMTTAELAQHVGYVAQNPDHQIFNATVEAEVGFAMTVSGFPHAETQERVRASLQAMDLWEVRHRHPLALPKGDRARVVIAAILAMQPEVMILDEPTTGQDDAGARQILDVTRRLHDAGKTIIVITHHLDLLPGYAERVVVMGAGTIRRDAPIREAFADREALQASFLTSPQVVQLYDALTPGLPHRPPLTPVEMAAWLVGEPFERTGGNP